jgi:hypothetical protein
MQGNNDTTPTVDPLVGRNLGKASSAILRMGEPPSPRRHRTAAVLYIRKWQNMAIALLHGFHRGVAGYTVSVRVGGRSGVSVTHLGVLRRSSLKREVSAQGIVKEQGDLPS